MKMTQETDVLKEENADLLSILKEMQTAVSRSGSARYAASRS